MLGIRLPAWVGPVGLVGVILAVLYTEYEAYESPEQEEESQEEGLRRDLRTRRARSWPGHKRSGVSLQEALGRAQIPSSS